MKFISNFAHTKTAKVVAGALVLATVLSFQGLVNADIGNGDRTLVVVVFNGNPGNDVRVSGATVRINGGADDGLQGTTNSAGTVTFNVREGDFGVTISHPNFYTQDFPVRMDVGFVELDAPMIPRDNGGGGGGGGGGNGCSPTPPRGRPLLNIWPISTSGAACTDYPLLSVKNVSQGTNWSNGSTVSASAGDTLRVEMYVHNGTLDFPENIAKNVRVKSSVSTTRISGEAWADNADRITSSGKGGNTTLNLPSGASISYVPGSTILYDRNMSNARSISDGIVDGGVGIGDMRGCFEFLHLVTFDLRVSGPSQPQNGTITVTKVVINDDGGTRTISDFVLRVSGTQVTSGVATTFAPGTYTITESGPTSEYTATFSGDCNSSGQLSLGANENKSCTVTNNDRPVIGPCIATVSGRVFVDHNGNGVFDGNDQPRANSSVTLHNSSGGLLRTDTTDGSGFYRFTNVTEGNYRVKHTVPTGYTKTTDDDVPFRVCPNFVHDFGFKPIVVVQGNLTITKNVRNVSRGETNFVNVTNAFPNEQVEFQMRLTAFGGAVDNVTFSDILPGRLNYVPNSLTVDGAPNSSNINSVSLGNFANNQTKTVIIRATAADRSQFIVGTTPLINTALANYSGTQVSAFATVNVIVEPIITIPLVCVQSVTTAQINQVVNFSATGGPQNPSYTWSAPGGNPSTGSGANFSTSFASAGTYNITVRAGDQSSVCTVVVNVVVPENPSLTISKTVRNITQGGSFAEFTNANPNEQVEFRIVVSSTGLGIANNVVVTDVLPNNFTLVSGNTSFNLGNMNPGTSQTVTLTARLASEGSFTSGSSNWVNTATASSSNTPSVSDTATVIVSRTITSNNASLNLNKEVRNVTTNTSFSNSTTATPNQTVQFRLTVTNTSSNVTAVNVRVTDFLPSGLTYVNGTFTSSGSVNSGSLFGGGQFLGNLNPGQTVVMQFQATVNSNTPNQTLINSATAFADNANQAQASATVFVSTVAGGNVDLVLSKRAFNQTKNVDATTIAANPGDMIIYTLSVRNNGNAAATNYVFQDDISDILQLAQLNDFGGATFHTGNLSLVWPQVVIPAGSTIEKTFSVKVNSSFPAGSDNIMTNVFGNTVNVRVNRPVVAGVFKAPPTGGSATAAFALSIATVLGYVIYKRYQISWQKQQQELSQ